MGRVRTLWCGAVLCLAGSSVYGQPEGWGACPREALTRMLEASVEHRQVSDIAAIERDVLRLCNARQELVNRIFEGEARLAELRGAGAVATTTPAGAVLVAAAQDAPAKSDEREEVELVVEPPEPVDEALDGFVDPVLVEAQEAPAPALSWTTVYGSAGEWIAGVSDGVQVWYVRQGDALPTGERVVSVRVRPPGVAVGHNGQVWQLPGPGA